MHKMKAFAIIILLFIESAYIFTQKPPELVVNELKNKFPSAINIKWVKQSNKHSEYTVDLNNNNFKLVKVSFYYYWEASFNLNDKKLSVSITEDGHWIVSKMKISIAELRDEVMSGVKYYYPSCEIISIEMIESVAVGTFYEIYVKCGAKEYGEIYDSNGYRIRQ